MTPLEALVERLAEAALLRIHHAIDLRFERAHRTVHAMSVARTRGLGQLFRHARAHVRAIQQGAPQ